MKQPIYFAVVLLLAVPLAWLQSAHSQTIRVSVDLKPELHASAKRIDFTGKTNLPAGTVLIFHAGPKIGPLNTKDRRLSLPSNQIPWGAGTLKTAVKKDGSFQGQLRTSGKVKTGTYLCKIEITIYTFGIAGNSRGQPDEVYEIVGIRGEKLTGPLVKNGTSPFGSFCEIRFQSEVDFLQNENARIKHREKRKYEQLLAGFKQSSESLLNLRAQGAFLVPNNQMSWKWNQQLMSTATSVEFLNSQQAIKHLRNIRYELEQMHLNSFDRRDQEFGKSEVRYEAAVQDFRTFIDGIK